MLPDLIPGACVRFLVGIDLDDTAIGCQFEMVLRFLVRKAHGVVAALIHAGRMLVRRVLSHGADHLFRAVACRVLEHGTHRLVLRVSCYDGEQEAGREQYFHCFFLS